MINHYQNFLRQIKNNTNFQDNYTYTMNEQHNNNWYLNNIFCNLHTAILRVFYYTNFTFSRLIHYLSFFELALSVVNTLPLIYFITFNESRNYITMFNLRNLTLIIYLIILYTYFIYALLNITCIMSTSIELIHLFFNISMFLFYACFGVYYLLIFIK